MPRVHKKNVGIFVVYVNGETGVQKYYHRHVYIYLTTFVVVKSIKVLFLNAIIIIAIHYVAVCVYRDHVGQFNNQLNGVNRKRRRRSLS